MRKPLRTLIVEDSIIDVELLLYELRRGGYEPTYEVVETPEGMREALENRDWDIVMSDYAMPHFDGLAALEIIKAKGLDLPFIIVSGAIGEDVAVEAMKSGAHDYILKDNRARLVAAVERELREAEVRRKRKQAEDERDRLLEQLQQVNNPSSLGDGGTRLQVEEVERRAAGLEAIHAAIAEALVVYGPAGEIVRINPAAADIFGCSPVECEKPSPGLASLLRFETPDGKPFPPEDTPTSKALQGQAERGVLMAVHRISDGRPIWLSVSAAPIRSSDGEIRGAVTTFCDITGLREQNGLTRLRA